MSVGKLPNPGTKSSSRITPFGTIRRERSIVTNDTNNNNYSENDRTSSASSKRYSFQYIKRVLGPSSSHFLQTNYHLRSKLFDEDQLYSSTLHRKESDNLREYFLPKQNDKIRTINRCNSRKYKKERQSSFEVDEESSSNSRAFEEESIPLISSIPPTHFQRDTVSNESASHGFALLPF